MKKIGLLSDTHSHLDDTILNHFEHVDEIWHAGDIGDLSVVDRIEACKPLRAVYGNIDGIQAKYRFPEIQSFVLEGLSVLMIHIGGYPGKYPARIKKLIMETNPDLFICGHSHILKIIPDKKNQLLHINPGACGNHGFHQIKTVVRFELENAHIRNLEIIELGLRAHRL